MTLNIDFTLSPTSEEIETIYQGLGQFNQKHVPEIDDQAFAFFIRDESGAVIGGLTGFIYITSIQIRFLWLSEALRNQGTGRQLIEQVENEAKQRNIPNIAVDTYTFQAPGFYELCGFDEIGRYKDYLTQGVDKIFYHKRVTNNG
ncbi:acetyltransferase [Vibrio aerogenes CECT 7868]|uniref:Acetyltransferase n=1 Tax=Vibrio aerogenes CECT 7868 TaxID=1216006 RepID=A0A1M5XAG1_9VIBR|nr:GNAT family N-acetyltransferase [Vibrio aerogenes]SHH96855.1 acetyltransferase [Vibrio aerogenes CECT 7868]